MAASHGLFDSKHDQKQSQVKPILAIPRQIEQNDQKTLQKNNGKLLTDEQIQKVKEQLKDEKVGFRYPKFHVNGVRYAILKGKNDYYAIYNVGDDKAVQQYEISEGFEGKIKLAQRLSDGAWFVLKTEKHRINGVNGFILNEHLLSQHLGNTPDILFYRLNKSKSDFFKKNPTVEKVEFLMDYIHGIDLNEYRERLQNDIDEHSMITIALSVLDAYHADVYSKGLIHCDLKYENMIFNPDTNQIKIVDFSFARQCEYTESITRSRIYGTHGFIAPEVYNYKNYSHATDIYSLGAIIRGLLFHEYVNADPNTCEQQFAPFDVKSPRKTQFANDLGISTFVNLMLHDDPSKRPNFEKVHNYFRNIKNAFVQSLQKQRESMDQANTVERHFPRTPQNSVNDEGGSPGPVKGLSPK